MEHKTKAKPKNDFAIRSESGSLQLHRVHRIGRRQREICEETRELELMTEGNEKGERISETWNRIKSTWEVTNQARKPGRLSNFWLEQRNVWL